MVLNIIKSSYESLISQIVCAAEFSTIIQFSIDGEKNPYAFIFMESFVTAK